MVTKDPDKQQKNPNVKIFFSVIYRAIFLYY